MAKKITHCLILTLLLTLGFGQLLTFQVFGLTLYLHDLIVVLILLFRFPELIRIVRRPGFPLSYKLIVLGLVIGFIRALTLFPLTSLLVPLLYSLRLTAYLALYLVLPADSRQYSRYLTFSGFTAAVIGLTQFFFYPDMRVFAYLGWDDHLNRLTLPHFDPTYSGLILGMFVLFSLQINQSLLTIVNGLALLFTYSRSIWASLAISLFLALPSRRLRLLSFTVLCIGILLLPKRFGEGNNLLRTYSITSRYSHDLSLARSIGPHFVLGIGYNSLPLFTTPTSSIPNHATSFNNSFLTILATTGLVGLAGWLLFLYDLSRLPSFSPMVVFIALSSLANNTLLYSFALLYLIIFARFATARR